MKAKLAGLALLSGMSLAASAATYQFTPITQPIDTSRSAEVTSLANQMAMNVTDGGNNTALFTFTNSGSIASSISNIYFDDSPSNLFSNVAVQGSNGAVSFESAGADTLHGGNIAPYNFTTTHRFTASDGVTSTSPGESVTLAATLQGGKTFADVVNSLNAGNETNTSFLRIGLRLSVLDGLRDQFCGCGLSFLDKSAGGGGSGGGSPPPPIPEPETYGMLLAGLGLMSAVVRRRRKA